MSFLVSRLFPAAAWLRRRRKVRGKKAKDCGNGKKQTVHEKTGNPSRSLWKGSRCGWAASYFPTVSRSIIAAAGLNFSVRNGKRCAPAQWPPLGLSCLSPASTGREGEQARDSVNRTPAEAPGPLVPLGSTCRHAHTCGLSTSSSPTALKGGLISGRASRLDAFSAYPLRTRLPGRAPGGATGSP